MQQRKTGILLHITSLPGSYGNGDIGSSISFMSFLKKAGVGCWQFLPTCPVSAAFAYSPYMGYSAFAGNLLLISPEMMVADDFLVAGDLLPFKTSSPYVADFVYSKDVRLQLIAQGFADFDRERSDFRTFCQEQDYWLSDYALFMVLKEEFNQQSWLKWPDELKFHERGALSVFAKTHHDQLMLVKFEQFLFFSQWQQLRLIAKSEGVVLFGDMPIYVGHDSADVWGNQSVFDLDPAGEPLLVAGVPPDYFSKTGQRWGNPLYKWQENEKVNTSLYQWWQNRFKQIRHMVDMVRIDHFRGFESYWAIDSTEETAINGTWIPGPGIRFFKEMKGAIGDLEIIAEDLGVITPEVEALRDECNFPGMKILQFAFGSGADNSYLPQNYTTPNTVVYGGTHDNDTAVGWLLDPETPKKAKDDFRRLANSDGSSPHHDFNRIALGSTARLAIIAMQDLLGFGSDCRMNTPGTVANNWLWRCDLSSFSEEVATYLYMENKFFNRLVNKEMADGSSASILL